MSSALQAANVSSFTLHAIPSPLLELPACTHPDSFAMALYPPSTSLHGPMPHVLCHDRALAEILPQAPSLKLVADSIVYTDGSKRGTSITAAWVHPGNAFSEAMSIPGPSSAQHTALRGELVAIHAALHSPQLPSAQPLHVMTDSLTSLYLIAAYLVRPTQFRFHKHRWLIAAIAQSTLLRSAPVLLTKVRAHIGVRGNTCADDLAASAHDADSVCISQFKDPCLRGPAWVQYWYGDTLSDLDDLKHHAIRIANLSALTQLQNKSDHLKSKTLLKVQTAITSQAGLHLVASNAYWGSTRVKDFHRTLVLQVRLGTLVTRSKLAKWYPSQGISPACPLCSAPKDTIAHRLGACSALPIKRQICARHGHAVNAIAIAIRGGALGNCALMCDAECHERYVSFPPAFLPLHLQVSRPDIVLLANVHDRFPMLPIGTRRDPRVVVHLIEVGFTSDLLVHDRVQVKLDQHEQLRRNLLAYGWADVRVHPIIIGHTGVMRATTAAIMSTLGLPPRQVDVFLCELAIASMLKSCAILTCFPNASSSTPSTDGPSDAPSPHPPSTPPANPMPFVTALPPASDLPPPSNQPSVLLPSALRSDLASVSMATSSQLSLSSASPARPRRPFSLHSLPSPTRRRLSPRHAAPPLSAPAPAPAPPCLHAPLSTFSSAPLSALSFPRTLPLPSQRVFVSRTSLPALHPRMSFDPGD